MPKLGNAAFLPVALVLANVSGLAISLYIPFLLSAAEYSIFAVTWGIGQFIASLAFEWLRYSVMRFSVGADESVALIRRHVIWRLYVGIAVAMLLLSALLLAAVRLHPLAGMAAGAVFYSVCQGIFDGRQARARALFDNSYYSTSWVVRSFLSLVLSSGAAWLTHEGQGALFGLAISYPLTMLLMNRRHRFSSPEGEWSGEQLAFLANYGFFAAIAANISWLLPTILRLAAVATLGLASASGFLLAADLSQKAVSVIGLAVNIVIMQLSIKAVEFGSETEVRRRARQQISVSTLFVAPAALGFFLIQPSFVHMFVPQDYQAIYLQTIGLCCVAAGVVSFRMFAIDSLFVAFGNTRPAVFGPIASVIILLALTWLLSRWSGHPNAEALAFALVIASLSGAGIAALLVSRVRKHIWPWAELSKIVAGCLLMFGAASIFSLGVGMPTMMLQILAYGSVYTVVSLATNAAGIGTLTKRALSR